MKLFFLLLLALSITITHAQTIKPKKRSVTQRSQTPKQLPGLDETADYIKGKILTAGLFAISLDNYRDVTDAIFDRNSQTLILWEGTPYQFPNWYQEIKLGNLNANAMTWIESSGDLIVLRIAAKNGMLGSTIGLFSSKTGTSGGTKRGYADIGFSKSVSSDIADFRRKIVGSFKHLIELCGGVGESKDPF